MTSQEVRLIRHYISQWRGDGIKRLQGYLFFLNLFGKLFHHLVSTWVTVSRILNNSNCNCVNGPYSMYINFFMYPIQLQEQLSVLYLFVIVQI